MSECERCKEWKDAYSKSQDRLHEERQIHSKQSEILLQEKDTRIAELTEALELINYKSRDIEIHGICITALRGAE